MKKALMRKQASSISNESKLGTPAFDKGEGTTKKKIEDMSIDEVMGGQFSDAESGDAVSDDGGDSASDDSLSMKDEDEDFVDITPLEFQEDISEDDEKEEEGSNLHSQNKLLGSEVQKHKKQLERLKEKDPEFFQFLKEHDAELLQFDDEDEAAEDAKETHGGAAEKIVKPEASKSSLSTALVEVWCNVIKEKQHMGTVRNLLRAYRTACHYGDGEEEEFANSYTISSSHVFNKIMFFTLSEIDGVFRKLLGKEGKNEKEISVSELEKCTRWKKVEPLIKSYLGNTLHILNQMTDNQMIAFTLRRLKASVCFLAALPRFTRKYLKVALHFWGRGEGSASLISFLFVREMAIHLGTDFLDACLKGIYKEYAANSKFVNASTLPRVRFMANCVVELYGIDFGASYQHAFVFIRQLAVVFRNALTMKTKDSYKDVYSWQYINCLELWVQVLCMYASKKDLQPLTYPVTQIITGVANLVPTARYFPLRLQCVKMLNKLAGATSSFIPVASLLLDMLQFKELNKPPTGGVGKAIDFVCTLKVPKPTLKTRAFQDECIAAVVEQFSEHLVLWSYAIAFPELALVPLIGLRQFMKETKVDRFRRQMKQLVDHIEQNIEYIGRKRDAVNFSPKDASLVSSFLKEEKSAGLSPLSQFTASLRQKGEQRRASLHTASILLKEDSQRNFKAALASEKPEDNDDDGATVFSSDWLPSKRPKGISPEKKGGVNTLDATRSSKVEADPEAEDIVEDLELSSDDDDDRKALLSSDEEQVREMESKRHKSSDRKHNSKSNKLQKGRVNFKPEEQRNGRSKEARKKGKNARNKASDFKKG